MSGYNMAFMGNHLATKPPVLACPVCGREFTAKARNQKYCSQFCKRSAKKGLK